MPHLVQLSLAELTARAEAWDRLWHCSESRLPSNMAAGIALWRETFRPNAEFNAIAVEEGDQLMAALPLLHGRIGPLRSFQLPSNCTVVAGDLIVDPAAAASTIDLIVEGLASLPPSILVFEGIEIESDRWRKLSNAMSHRGMAIHQSRGHEVGIVDVLHDWDAYQSSWSRNHRSAIKRTSKKLQAEGEVTVQRVRTPSDDELHTMLETCFEIEDRSWKGDEGTSIAKTPGLSDYYHREARWMRDQGMLDLWLLNLDGETIAFEYCHFAKGICLSHKISFDPKWERFSPGRLLRYYQLEQYHGDPSCRQLDTLGVLCEAKAKWITRRYRSSRMYVGTRGGWPSLAIAGLKAARALRDRRRGPEEEKPIKAGAERYLELAKKTPAPIAPLPCADTTLPVRSEAPSPS